MAKALARAGVASRREVERLIGEGRVALNGRVLDTPAVKVGPADVLTVDGRAVEAAEATRLWRYHKPVGLMTTHNDPQGRRTVFETLPAHLPRVISIGRLDLASEGLLLLTNDGALSRALELPNQGWVRTYRARAFGRTDQAALDRLKDGITVDGVAYGSIEARLDKVQAKAGELRGDGRGERRGVGGANVWITLSLTEGKNREVRRVLEALGLKVNRLVRLAYGPFALGTLAMGQVEEVGPRVIREQLAGLIAPENMPTGVRTRSAAPAGSRRSPTASAHPRAGGAERDAASLPEPSEGERKVRKPGWAKAKKKLSPHRPSRQKTEAKPRDSGISREPISGPKAARPKPLAATPDPASSRPTQTPPSPASRSRPAAPPRSSAARPPAPPRGGGPKRRG